MDTIDANLHAASNRTAAKPRVPGRVLALLLTAALTGAQGCTALSNPVANGIPVRLLPPEQLGESKQNMQTIPLTMLRQPPVKAYLLGPGDVLGIWIEGVLGERGQPPPVRLGETRNDRAALGYPIPVRSDGTITLPLVPAIKVEGKTTEQVEDDIRKVYTIDTKIIQPGRERVLVTLQQRREYHILVIRQDSAPTGEGAGTGGSGGRSSGFIINYGGGTQGSRRGTGFALNLAAYENDVLNALARTGGFPGTDAVNEVVVERGSFRGEDGRTDRINALQNCQPGAPLGLGGEQKIRIPLRYRPGNQPTIRPEDVVLKDGDIVFIAARETDVFYTSGLLPAGEYVLPRDTDLDVIEAITRVGGAVLSSGISTQNISGTLLFPGIGFPSPSQLSIVRRTCDGGQYTIRVDLDRALRDPRERILIQPRDLLVLQETPDEALARYFSQAFKFNIIYAFYNNSHGTGETNFVSQSP